MTRAIRWLVKPWKKLATHRRSAPLLLPGDEALTANTRNYVLHKSYSAFVADPDYRYPFSDKRFHLGLIPNPYSGNLRTAKIFVLAVNPGFNPFNYYGEFRDHGFRKAKIKMLRQENVSEEFPFISLNPRYAWSSGARYWTERFKPIIKMVMQTHEIDVRTALMVISKNVAILECCPYHSQSFGLSLKHLKKMESWKRIERFVFDHLMPRARAGEIMIIVGLGQ